VEMMGETEFPRIAEGTYPLSLGPYGYFLFRLEQNVTSVAARASAPEPVVESVESRPALLAGVAWDTLLDGALRRYIERDALPGFVEAQRWSGATRGTLKAARFSDWGMLRAGTQPVFLTLIEAERVDGRRDQYLLPLATVTGPDADRIAKTAPGQVLARITGARKGLLVDAVVDDRACDLLLEAFASSREVAGQHGTIRAVRTEAWLPDEPGTLHPIRRSATDHPNSSVSYGTRKHLKLFRPLDAGLNPEIEIGSYLTRAGFTRVPPLVGSLEYQSAAGNHVPLGLLQGLVHNEGETWERTLDELGRYFERVTPGGALPPPGIPEGSLVSLAQTEPPEPVLAAIGVPMTAAAVLGRRTAEMHLALGRETDDRAFSPEPLDDGAVRAAADAVQARLAAVLAELDAARDRLPEDTVRVADGVLRSGVPARLAPRPSRSGWGRAIRVHGDYHLAQVLWSEQDVIIVDFEGDPSRPIDERRRKASPLADVASMVRSFGYATSIGLMAFTRQHPSPVAAPWATLWERWMAATFLRHYLGTLGASPLVPAAREDLAALLDLFVGERAAGELRNELQNRPEWAHIPLAALAELQEQEPET
jgi:maltose alpha-D-glucosyltransferase / alpha-amylase